MITKKELHEAMRVDNIRATTTSRALRANALDNVSDTVRAVALSLEVYRDRKEYDGSEHQAIDCLTRARFEIEGVEADAYES